MENTICSNEIEYRFNGGGSHKFWRICLVELKHGYIGIRTVWGRIGTIGTSTVTGKYAYEARALSAATKKMSEKLNKGYNHYKGETHLIHSKGLKSTISEAVEKTPIKKVEKPQDAFDLIEID